MKRYVIFCNALCLLLAIPSAGLAQFSPKTNSDAFESSSDPRARRANREKAVSMVGPSARDFVETYGDEAVAVIFGCSKAVGVKLVEFHASGELAKLPRPRDLLRVIADKRHRDDVALWAIAHAGELIDPDCFDAYLYSPLEYAMGLKQIQTGAASFRANRLNPSPATTTETTPTKLAVTLSSLTDDDRVGITACACLVILAIIAIWRKRQSQAY
jgi:hypothetical protein